VGKAYPPDELATRLFVISIVSAALFVSAVCIFVI